MFSSVSLLKRLGTSRTKSFSAKTPAVLPQRQVLERFREHGPMFRRHVLDRNQFSLNQLQFGHKGLGELGQLLGFDSTVFEPDDRSVIDPRGALLSVFRAGQCSLGTNPPVLRIIAIVE